MMINSRASRTKPSSKSENAAASSSSSDRRLASKGHAKSTAAADLMETKKAGTRTTLEKRPTRSDTAGGFISATPAENGGGGKTKRKTMKEVENPNKVTHKIVASRGSKNLVADEKSGKTAKKGTSLAKKLEEEVVVVYEDDFEDYESDFEEDEDQEQFEDDFEEEEVIDDHDEDDGKKVSKNGRVNEALNLKLLDPQTRAQISQSTLMKRVASAAGNRSSQQMVSPLTSNSATQPRRIHFDEATTTASPQLPSSSTTTKGVTFVVDPIFGTTAGGGGEDEGQSQIQRMRSSKFYEHFMQIADSVNAQRKLASTQTGEDSVTMGCQTEDWWSSAAGGKSEDRWTQAPPRHQSSPWTATNFPQQQGQPASEESSEKTILRPLLERFVARTGQLMVDLLHLEENREEYGEDGVDLGETLRAGTSAAAGLHLTLHYNSNMAFSSRYSVFSAARQALGGQHCRATALAIQEQNTDTTGGGNPPPRMLLAVYVPNTAELPTQNGARSPLRNRSLLLEFDPADHSGTPKMIFTTTNEVSTCCYSSAPDRLRAVFAGLKDGSCVVWARGPSTGTFPLPKAGRGPSMGGGKQQLPPQQAPVYSTAADVADSRTIDLLHSTDANRSTSPVVALVHTRDGNLLVALHELGVLNIWTVSTAAETTTFSTSQQLSENANQQPAVRLTKTATVSCWPTYSPAASRNLPLFRVLATCMAPLDENGSAFLVGTSTGVVWHAKHRHRGFLRTSSLPSQNVSRQFSTGADAQVCSLRIAPQTAATAPRPAAIFAVALTSHDVYLFCVASGAPLRRLTPPASLVSHLRRAAPVVHVEWSPTSPSLLYSVHGGDRLVMWFMSDDQWNQFSPTTRKVETEVCPLAVEDGGGHSTTAAGPPAIVATQSWGLARNGQLQFGTGFLALARLDGELTVHCLERRPTRTAYGGRR